MIQDIILSICALALIIAQFRQVMHVHETKISGLNLWVGSITTITLGVRAVTYWSLDLRMTAVLTVISVVQWGLILYMRRKYGV